jgi:hypothetical protein
VRLGGLTAEETLVLERPAMTYVRSQLGDRLQRQLARADRPWPRQYSGRRCGGGRLAPAADAVVAAGQGHVAGDLLGMTDDRQASPHHARQLWFADSVSSVGETRRVNQVRQF